MEFCLCLCRETDRLSFSLPRTLGERATSCLFRLCRFYRSSSPHVAGLVTWASTLFAERGTNNKARDHQAIVRPLAEQLQASLNSQKLMQSSTATSTANFTRPTRDETSTSMAVILPSNARICENGIIWYSHSQNAAFKMSKMPWNDFILWRVCVMYSWECLIVTTSCFFNEVLR